jgi:recombination protein RecT
VTLNPALRLAYLVPRKGAATLDISYMGLITILKKSGGCKYVDAFIVYQDEDFNYNPALGTIQHTPHFATTEAEQKARKMIGCYSRAVLPSNDTVFCYMPYWEIEKVKRFSEGSESKWSAWTTWEEEMVKKSVIKRHFKMLVSGSEAAEVVEALRIEEENNPLVKQPTKSSLFDVDFE